MALLYIKGQDEPIHFDDKHFEAVNQLFSEYLDGKGDAAVKLPDQTVRASNIKRVQRERKAKEEIEIASEEVKAFEKELEEYCAGAERDLGEPPYDLAKWGGEPYWRRNKARLATPPQTPVNAPQTGDAPEMVSVSETIQNSSPMRRSEAEEQIHGDLHPVFTVSNNLLGLVHFGIVKYAEEKGAIKHSGGEYGWSILNHGDQHAIITPYTEFRKKFDAVLDLRGRRQYAKAQEAKARAASTGVVAQALAQPAETPYQKGETDAPNPDDIPF